MVLPRETDPGLKGGEKIIIIDGIKFKIKEVVLNKEGIAVDVVLGVTIPLDQIQEEIKAERDKELFLMKLLINNIASTNLPRTLANLSGDNTPPTGDNTSPRENS